MYSVVICVAGGMSALLNAFGGRFLGPGQRVAFLSSKQDDAKTVNNNPAITADLFTLLSLR